MTKNYLAKIVFTLLTMLSTSPVNAIDLDSLPTNSWTNVTPTYVGAPNGGILYPMGWNNVGAYDPSSQRVLRFDRWHDTVRSSNIYANALLAYTPVTNVVTVLKLNNFKNVTPCPAGTPPGCGYVTDALPQLATDPTPMDRHPLGQVAFAADFNKFYLSNGLNGSAWYYFNNVPGTPVEDTWAFNLGTSNWAKVSEKTTSINPPFNGGGGGVMIYHPVQRKVVLFTDHYTEGPDTWLLDPTLGGNGQWTKLAHSPTANAVHPSGAGVAYDSSRNRILVLATTGLNLDPPNRQLWSYSLEANTWTRLADCPMAALGPGFSYDSNHDIFLALIGTNTFAYFPQNNTWTLVTAAMTRPGIQSFQSIVYDPAHDVFVFQGGSSGAGPAWSLFRYSSAPQAPAIVQNPSNQTVGAGTPAAFSILATGTPAPTYQWQINSGAGFTNISGATSSIYTISNPTLSDSGKQFRCIATNSQNSVTSLNATLTVTPTVDVLAPDSPKNLQIVQ